MLKTSILAAAILLSLFVTSVNADVTIETNDLTIQQYRVEALQDEYYRLKVSSDASNQAYKKQKERVKQTEKRLIEAKKVLVERQKDWQADQDKLNQIKSQLSAEEQKLNNIWDATHRKPKQK